MSTNRAGKGQGVATAKQLIAGTNKHFANAAQVTFGEGSFTPAQITGQLQALVTLRSDVDAATATARAKVATEETNSPPLRAFMSAYVAYVRVLFAKSPEALADFGITPKARSALTVEAKAAAVAKRAATRAARHTMGTKQKKGIKGDVTSIVVTPITSSVSTPTVTPPPSSVTTPATPAGPSPATAPRIA